MTAAAMGTRDMVVRYGLFAVAATAANIAAQEVAMRLSPVDPLTVSILTGTVVGFAVKYVLDKHYVFADAYGGHAEEARKVLLYGAFSIVTTLVFWSVEIAFWQLWQTPAAKYTGAVLGLAIGYAAKFLLDRRYVFARPARAVSDPPDLTPDMVLAALGQGVRPAPEACLRHAGSDTGKHGRAA